MATIQLDVTTRTETHASINVVVADDRKPRPYYLFVTKTYVTVVAGEPDRRKLGKTFHTLADLRANYKRDGAALVEIVEDARKEIGK